MIYKLFPSSLGLMKDCPRCFWPEQNEKLKRHFGIFPPLPSEMGIKNNKLLGQEFQDNCGYEDY